MAAELVQLNPGTRIDRWTVDKKLGEGGFGAVYKVTDGQGMYALKTEGVNEQIQVLKMEVYVLTELAKRGNRHFCKIEDKGRFGNFNYVVMTFVGKSLQDLRKEGAGQHMSMGTAISVGIQCLEALEDLHNIGYLHRDVKPGNYTVGRAELNELRKVYILDFGMCRKFTNDQGVIRKPREAAGFRGTVRYAPISCHLQRELCRKDDVEVWVYMQVELTTGNLPWKSVADMNQVGEYKKRCRQEPHIRELFAGCPPEYAECMRYCDSLKYYDTPNYQMMYGLMRKALTTMNVQEFPYDWEKPPAPAGGGYF
ncbi:CK1/WORM6 protein kinase [Aphelenchoides avenae]|nr:CK1/WORM6 protein kinase [Aphelenchus avenae]